MSPSLLRFTLILYLFMNSFNVIRRLKSTAHKLPHPGVSALLLQKLWPTRRTAACAHGIPGLICADRWLAQLPSAAGHLQVPPGDSPNTNS